MSDKTRDVNDEIFEALLKSAAQEAMKREMEAMPSCEELNKLYTPSDDLNKRVAKIIDSHERRYKNKRMIKSFMKIAASFAILLTISTIALMSVEASRIFILNTFINIRNDHVAFEFGQNGSSIGTNNIVAGYIPSGFELTNIYALETIAMLIYSNEHGEQIIIGHFTADSISLGVDNENRKFSIVYLNDQEAYLFEALDVQDKNILVWYHGNDLFTITSTISVEEIFRIAENVELR